MEISPGDEGDLQEKFDEEIVIDEGTKFVEALEKALKHVKDREAEFWIRTALQHLVVEQTNENDPSE